MVTAGEKLAQIQTAVSDVGGALSQLDGLVKVQETDLVNARAQVTDLASKLVAAESLAASKPSASRIICQPDLPKLTGTNWGSVVDPQRGPVGAATLLANKVGGGSGANLFIPLSERVDEAEFSYDIFIPNNFDWSGGGKLPGIIATLPGGLPSKATGCDSEDNDASYRVMWNGPKGGWTSTIGTQLNLSNAYIYRATPPGVTNPVCGEDNFGNKIPFVAGWQTVWGYMGLKSQTLELKISGKTVVSKTGYSWRRDENVKISHAVISIFRGGNDVTKFGSSVATNLRLDNFVVKTR